MRKMTAGLFHSLDGAVEGPDQWQFDAFDDESLALGPGILRLRVERDAASDDDGGSHSGF